MEWYKNLKKWQIGGIIGCAVGLLIACMLLFILNPSHYHSLGEWIANFHGALYLFPNFLALILTGDTGGAVLDYGGAVSIVIFYGALGALWGKSQQIEEPTTKWVLTGLLALFLLIFYFVNCTLLVFF